MTADNNELAGRRITFVVNSYSGTSETFLRAKILGLALHGADVSVLQTQPGSDAPSPAAEVGQGSISVHRAALAAPNAGQRVRELAGVLVRHSEVAARGRPDLSRSVRQAEMAELDPELVIFAFSGLAVAWHDAWRDLDVPVVVSCRGAAENVVPHTNPDRAPALSAVLKRVSAAHCVSESMAATIAGLGCPPERIFVNRPAVDLRRFLPVTVRRTDPSAPFLVTTVIRHAWTKGLEYALLAVRDVARAGIDIHYRIIGGGTETEKLTWMINDLGISDRAHLLGWRDPDDVFRELQNSDAYLLSSLTEGLNNSVLEAMATALPLVSTNVDGMAEAVIHEETGYLVDPYDPAGIADGLLRIARDPSGAEKMGLLARSRIETHFQIKNQARRFAQVYAAVLDGHPIPEPSPDLVFSS